MKFKQYIVAAIAVTTINHAVAAEVDLYRVKNGASTLSLYGVIKIDVANAYLSTYGLQAVEVAPGFALTGISSAYYTQNSVEWLYPSMPNVTGGYTVNYLPFLVKDPANPGNAVYFFTDITSSNETVNKTVGYEKSVSTFTVSKFMTSKAQVKTSVSGKRHFTMKTGAWSESQDNFQTENDLNVNILTGIGNKVVGANFLEAKGTIYKRDFNSKVDFYYVDEMSAHGKLFKDGGFIPTQWQILYKLDSRGYIVQ